METIVSDVPGLEGRAAREGTANAAFIGAANYWHERAARAERVLGERRVFVGIWVAVAFLAGVAVHGLWAAL